MFKKTEKDSDTTSMSAEERDLIRSIFKRRLSLFFSSYPVLLLGAIYVSLGIDSRTHTWSRATDGDFMLTRMQMYLVNLLFIGGIVVVSGVLIFLKRIWPYYRDAKLGIKNIIPRTVISKTFFSNTGQYFLHFADPNHMHFEVDAATYDKYNAGDVINTYCAPKSGYMFDASGMFSLM